MSDEKPTTIVLLRYSTKSILRIEWPIDVSYLDDDEYNCECDAIKLYCQSKYPEWRIKHPTPLPSPPPSYLQ